MSTTIKRVALVAVAALGLGVLTVAPSQAYSQSDSLTLSAAASTQLTSETATATSAVATLTFLADSADDSMTVTASLISAPAGNVALPQLVLTETTSAQAKLTKAGAAIALGGAPIVANAPVYVVPSATTYPVNASAKFKVFMNAPAKVGTYVVKLTPAVSGTGSLNATAQTLTITVAANPADDTVAASATSYINAGETVSATADVSVTSSKVASTSDAAAVIKVTLKNANADTVSESYTATVSGPGLLGSGAFGTGTTLANGVTATGRALTVKASDVVAVFPDGTSGVSTVTISSAAGKVLATETLTFFGDAAKIVSTVKKSVIGGTDSVADVLSIVVTDAAGVSVSNLTSINVVSSSVATIAGAYTGVDLTGKYSTTTGAYLVALTPVAAGTANITVTTKASAAATTGVSADAVAVRVGSRTPASVKVTTDKSSYAPGEAGTLTVQLFDKDGLELASGETYTAIFKTGGIVSSYVLKDSDAINGTDVISYTAGGKAYSFYAPVTEGDVTFKYTTGSTDSALKTGLATANQAVANVVTINVSSAATSAAIDAANEAAQAASDATDAALAAADAADAATTKAQEAVDAVATLSAQVSKLITALKAQITTLTNLVIKIQKKVKA